MYNPNIEPQKRMDSDVTLRATKILDAVVSGGASAIGAVDHGTADIPLVDMLLERRSAAGALLALPTIIKRTPTAPATSAPHEAADVRRCVFPEVSGRCG